MPAPLPGTAEDKALWARAEQIAEALVDEEDRAILTALDRAFEHRKGLESGTPSDSSVLEPLFEESRHDLEGAKVWAQRVWDVLNGRIWDYSPAPTSE